jgi:hypothetical protein
MSVEHPAFMEVYDAALSSLRADSERQVLNNLEPASALMALDVGYRGARTVGESTISWFFMTYRALGDERISCSYDYDRLHTLPPDERKAYVSLMVGEEGAIQPTPTAGVLRAAVMRVNSVGSDDLSKWYHLATYDVETHHTQDTTFGVASDIYVPNTKFPGGTSYSHRAEVYFIRDIKARPCLMPCADITRDVPNPKLSQLTLSGINLSVAAIKSDSTAELTPYLASLHRTIQDIGPGPRQRQSEIHGTELLHARQRDANARIMRSIVKPPPHG